MADIDTFQPYTRRSSPQIPGSEWLFIQEELARLQASLQSVRAVLDALETRIVALEP